MGIQKSASKMQLESLDQIFKSRQSDIVQITIEELEEFKGHPFRVIKDNSDMNALIESVKEAGVLVPGLCRKRENGRYEIVSGHRRVFAARAAGLKKVPMIVKQLTDEEAVIAMVDANLQREDILPSERAWAYRMKSDAIKRKKNEAGIEERKDWNEGREKVGVEAGTSGRTVARYIRLTYLNKELLDFIDCKKMNFLVGVELSFCGEDMQRAVINAIQETGLFPSLVQAEKITALLEEQETRDEKLDFGAIEERLVSILKGSNTLPKRSFSLSSKKLKEYFPESYSQEEVNEIILELLEEWKRTHAIS